MFSLWSAFPVMGETLSPLAAALCVSLVFLSLWEAANRERLVVGIVLHLYPAPSSVPSNPFCLFHWPLLLDQRPGPVDHYSLPCLCLPVSGHCQPLPRFLPHLQPGKGPKATAGLTPFPSQDFLSPRQICGISTAFFSDTLSSVLVVSGGK